MIDDEIGYVQGMNDLAAPIVEELESDAVSYWAYKKFMKRMRPNFLRDQSGISMQLKTLGVLVKMIDPQLYIHVKNIGNFLNFNT